MTDRLKVSPATNMGKGWHGDEAAQARIADLERQNAELKAALDRIVRAYKLKAFELREIAAKALQKHEEAIAKHHTKAEKS